MVRWLILSAGVVASLPSVAAQPYVDPHPCAASCEVQRFLDQNVGVKMNRPLTLDELRKFAPLTSDDTVKVANPLGDVRGDTIHALHFEGLTLRAEVTPEGNVLVQEIDLTGGAYRMAFNIKLGKIAGPHDIDFVLGAPAETHPDASGRGTDWVYRNLEGTASVTFVRTDTAILSVHWDFSGGD
jgi:hypothetical protein